MAKGNLAKQALYWLAQFSMVGLGITQLFDFIFTSLSIQDWLGTGNTFKWAPAEAFTHFNDVQSSANTHTIDNDRYHHEDALTKYGYMMIENYGNHPEEYLWASIGYFSNEVEPEQTDMCLEFAGVYRDVYLKRNRFMTTREKMSLVKPLSLKDSSEDHAYWDPEHTDLEQLEREINVNGYVPSRRAVEIRMTARMDFEEEWNDVKNTNKSAHKEVKAVRFYAKSFCDGCNPIAELGQMFCDLYMTMAPGTKEHLLHITVHEAHRRHDSSHRMGLAIPSSNNAYLVTVVRIMILIYVAHAYLNILTNSTKSNEERYFMFKQEGADAATLMSSKVQRPFMSEFFNPEQNICRAQPFSISFLMYNSDAIVLLNLIVVVFTFMTSLIIKDEVVWWSSFNQTFRGVITRIGVNAKMMWLYIAVIKVIKHVFIKLRFNRVTILMSFHSHIFVSFFIVYLILLSISGMDFLLDAFFHDRIDIVNDFELMNDVTVLFELGFYVQRLPAIFLHTIVTSTFALCCLMALQFFSGTSRPHHSLYKTFACCHSTLIWDPNMFESDPTATNAASKKTTMISMGTLMNIKWMLKVHCMTYPIFDLSQAEGLSSAKTSVISKRDSGADDDDDDSNVQDNATKVEIGVDGALHIILRSTKMDLEQTLVYYKWLQNDRTLRIF